MSRWALSAAAAVAAIIIQSSGVSFGQDAVGLTDVKPPVRVQTHAQVGAGGLTPAQVRRAYGFDRIANKGAGQTIGIIEAFDHPLIEEDLAVFTETFGLRACTSANGCLRKIYASGSRPRQDHLWAFEIALDVEWAHAMAPEAQILLVEAPSARLTDMLAAVDLAVQNGASVVSMSWGARESANELSNDNHFVASGVMFVASSGDFGTGVLYPAASPDVIGVGSTTLSTDAHGNYLGETANSGSGGGQSAFEVEPSHQTLFGIPNNPEFRRGVPDVAYNGDIITAGFLVYDSIPLFGEKGWSLGGGSSAGAPQWAALLAIVNSSRAAEGKGALSGNAAVLYDAAKTEELPYNDITTGTNGTCGVLCTAAPGYDYVTGLGSPRANRLIPKLVRK